MERGKLHKATAGTGTATISSFHCGPGKFKLPVRPGQEFKADKKLLKPYLCYSFIHFKGRCIFKMSFFKVLCPGLLYPRIKRGRYLSFRLLLPEHHQGA